MNTANQTPNATNPMGYISAMVHEIEALNEKVAGLTTLSIKELEEIKAQIGLLNRLTDCYCQKMIQVETVRNAAQMHRTCHSNTPPYPTSPHGYNPQHVWNNPNGAFGNGMGRPPYPQQHLWQSPQLQWSHQGFQPTGIPGYVNELAQNIEQGVDGLRGMPTMDDFPPAQPPHGDVAPHNQELLANHIHHGDGVGEDLATSPL